MSKWWWLKKRLTKKEKGQLTTAWIRLRGVEAQIRSELSRDPDNTELRTGLCEISNMAHSLESRMRELLIGFLPHRDTPR